MVEAGRVPKGSVLIVENIDRLSRLPPAEATQIVTRIVRAGIDLVTTAPEQVYTSRNLDALSTWLPLQVSHCLAREESVKKSDRQKDVWSRKRAAINGGAKLSKRGPFWLRLAGGKWKVVPKAAAIVRQVFEWAAHGLGSTTIAARLNRDCPAGPSGKGWQCGNLNRLVRSRAVLGEYQPHTGTAAKRGGIAATRKPFGPPVADYFPRIVSDSLFYRAQNAVDGRRGTGGPRKKTPSLFSGLLWDLTTGGTMVLHGSGGERVLVPSAALRKLPGAVFSWFPYEPFERALLYCLDEVKPSDLTGSGNLAADEVAGLSAELTAVNRAIELVKAKAETAEDPSDLLDLLATYGAKRKRIAAALEVAKGKAVSPAADALGETRALLELIDGADGEVRDDLRSRLGAAIRRLVTRIDVRVAAGQPRGWRLAFARVAFVDGHERDYFAVSHCGEVRVLSGATPAAVVAALKTGKRAAGVKEHVATETMAVTTPMLWQAMTPVPARPPVSGTPTAPPAAEQSRPRKTRTTPERPRRRPSPRPARS